MGNIINIDQESFETEVLKCDLPVLVDFWAQWCNPCKMLSPILEEIAKEFEGRIKIVKINIDVHQKLATDFGIRAIPTMVIFKEGKEVDRYTGVIPKQELIRKLNKHI